MIALVIVTLVRGSTTGLPLFDHLSDLTRIKVIDLDQLYNFGPRHQIASQVHGIGIQYFVKASLIKDQVQDGFQRWHKLIAEKIASVSSH